MKNLTIVFFLLASSSIAQEKNQTYDTRAAEFLYDLKFDDIERDSLQEGLKNNLERIKALHQFSITNATPPALIFQPLPVGFTMPEEATRDFGISENVNLPSNHDDLAFYSVSQLSVLIREKKITSKQLTTLYIRRLKKYSDTLECTVSLLEERALNQARKLDEETSRGIYRGPLHGIPYGLKDLFAVEGTITSWGAMAYKDQEIEQTATIVKRLDDAGAVLVAKLTLGALAMGDVWYGGKTRNPWNLEQGSSGSSAGPGAATSAGLVAFSIGTETLGSIISPSTRNGVTGLRPTFGRVSRAGGMALSWSMDKVGPMCRTALDCALVLEAIYGPDDLDQSVIDAPYNYDQRKKATDYKIGYLKTLFDRDYGNHSRDSITLEVFKSWGVKLEAVELPDNLPYSSMLIILASEAGAAFDELTRSGRDEMLVRQDKGAWPNYFRGSRFIPAVEYIQANRVRYIMIQEMNKLFEKYDAIITPSFGGPQMLATNLSGHPVISIPNGFNDRNSPTSISIIGGLFEEGVILHLARQYQEATPFDEMHPPFFKN